MFEFLGQRHISSVKAAHGSIRGFTLIELVIVITLLGALSALATAVFMRPFENYERVTRQIYLLMAGEAALNRMDQDFTTAVPNSIRIASAGAVQVIEMMHIESTGRYRYSSGWRDRDALTPEARDNRFEVLGRIPDPTNATRMVVGPIDIDALYFAATRDDAGFITPNPRIVITKTARATTDRVRLSRRFRFDEIGVGTLRKQFYMVDTMVTYRCDPTNKTLYRYTDYAPAAVVSSAIPGGSFAALVSDQVESCEFEYKPDSSLNYGYLNLNMTFGDENAVRLFKQARVSNVP